MLRSMFRNAMTSNETAPAPNAIAHTTLPIGPLPEERELNLLRPSGMGGFGSGINILNPHSQWQRQVIGTRRQADQNASPLSRILWPQSFFEPSLAQDVLGRTDMHMFANCVLMNAIFWLLDGIAAFQNWKVSNPFPAMFVY